MKTDPFDVITKYESHTAGRNTVNSAPATDLTEGRIIAVEICSNVLEEHIWLALDESFDPKDGQAVFYADELPFLATKDADTLREIHKSKLAFPGSRVRQ